MKFAVFTHVVHKKRGGSFYAAAPYVREMNRWFSHVGEVEVVAPMLPGPPGAAEMAYEHRALSFERIPALALTSFWNSLKTLLLVPVVCLRIFRSMARAEHLHLRCPGNVGLLACLLQLLFPHKPKSVKYAGNWEPESEQPWSYRLQRWILNNGRLTRNAKVLVYGDWEGSSGHVLPFFTASFSERHRQRVLSKDFRRPYRFLFVGSLVPGKGPALALQLVERLRGKGIPARLDMYGEGTLRTELEDYIQKKQLKGYVHLHGVRSAGELREAYQRSHFVVLLSRSEGWPKALAEGMFHGCIPIATEVSCVPWMLGHGKRGILSAKSSTEALPPLTERISGLMHDAEELQRLSAAARQWSQLYTLESFDREIRQVLLGFGAHRERKAAGGDLHERQGLGVPVAKRMKKKSSLP